MMNDYLQDLGTPEADLIGFLEKTETNLAHIAVQFIMLEVHFNKMEMKCSQQVH